MTIRYLLLSLLMFAGPVVAATSVGDDAAAIRQVLAAQQAAWNRGDVETFMHGYKDSPDTTFVGSSIDHGYRKILASYRAHYANREQMGRLSFSDIEVRLLPATSGTTRYAYVTGRYHLERTAHGSVAQDDGVYSLLWEKTEKGWKIILDHSS